MCSELCAHAQILNFIGKVEFTDDSFSSQNVNVKISGF